VTLRRPGLPTLLASLAAVAILLGAELAAGALHFGEAGLRDPCAHRPASPAASDTLSRVVLSGLDGAACKLGLSREQLALDLAEGGGKSLGAIGSLDAPGTRQRVEQALRSGLDRAISDAQSSGSLNLIEAVALRAAVAVLPIEQLLSAVAKAAG
jgi:hypothetical protein